MPTEIEDIYQLAFSDDGFIRLLHEYTCLKHLLPLFDGHSSTLEEDLDSNSDFDDPSEVSTRRMKDGFSIEQYHKIKQLDKWMSSDCLFSLGLFGAIHLDLLLDDQS